MMNRERSYRSWLTPAAAPKQLKSQIESSKTTALTQYKILDLNDLW